MFQQRRAELFPLADEELIKPVLAQSPGWKGAMIGIFPLSPLSQACIGFRKRYKRRLRRIVVDFRMIEIVRRGITVVRRRKMMPGLSRGAPYFVRNDYFRRNGSFTILTSYSVIVRLLLLARCYFRIATYPCVHACVLAGRVQRNRSIR